MPITTRSRASLTPAPPPASPTPSPQVVRTLPDGQQTDVVGADESDDRALSPFSDEEDAKSGGETVDIRPLPGVGGVPVRWFDANRSEVSPPTTCVAG